MLLRVIGAPNGVMTIDTALTDSSHVKIQEKGAIRGISTQSEGGKTMATLPMNQPPSRKF